MLRLLHNFLFIQVALQLCTFITASTEPDDSDLPWQARVACGDGSVAIAMSAGLTTFCAGGALYMDNGKSLRMIHGILTRGLTSTHSTGRIMKHDT